MAVNVIEQIWSGNLELHEEADLPPLAGILNSLLAAPLICFTSRMEVPAARPFVGHAGLEILPGASLSDVLFEEFEIEISDQTIVLIEPLGPSKAEAISSQALGEALGTILVELSGMNQYGHGLITKSEYVHQSCRPAERRNLVSLVQ